MLGPTAGGGHGYEPEAAAAFAALHPPRLALSCFIFDDGRLLVVSENKPYTQMFCVSQKGNDISEEWLCASLRVMKRCLFEELPYIVHCWCVLGVRLFYFSLLVTPDSSQSNDSRGFFFGWLLFHFRIKVKKYSKS